MYDQYGKQGLRGSSSMDGGVGGGGGGGGGDGWSRASSARCNDAGMTAEQVFEMFMNGGGFGTNFPTFTSANRRGSAFYFGGQDGFRRPTGATAGGGAPPRSAGPAGPAGSQRRQDGWSFLLQLLPLLLLLFLFSPFTSNSAPRPVFSLSRTSPYTEARETATLKVPYFVEPAHLKKLRTGADVTRLDASVEDYHLEQLEQQCMRDRRTMHAQRRGNAASASAAGAASSQPASCERLDEQLAKRRNHL